jgi:D-tyrosyl-tRNA(Tyr) deacylase
VIIVPVLAMRECLPVRAVVQRVSAASVTVAGSVVAELVTPGLLVLLGVTHDDTSEVASALASKVYYLRILAGEKSCADTGAPLLVVSQFTLYANTDKGRRPSWSAAAPRTVAEPLVSDFAQALRTLGGAVQTGVFGADMAVALVNDGPVTLILEATAGQAQ